jgi:hypothetical protein
MTSNTTVVPLDLAYKGTRDYLHGTDIYSAIVEHFSRTMPEFAHCPLRIAIHGFARNQCDLLYTVGAERMPRPEDARVEFSFEEHVYGWLAETTRPVQSRRPYSEDEAVATSRIEGNTIRSGPTEGFSAIEVLVAVTKRLHMTLRPYQPRWAFARLELSRPLELIDAGRLKVELVDALGDRLTKSLIVSSNAALGHIYFSAIRK